MTTTCFAPLVIGNELKAYFDEHTVLNHQNCVGDAFYKVTKPLHVFKKVCVASDVRWVTPHADAIANLIIPRGAVIYAAASVFDPLYVAPGADWRKMRASRARVHSIVEITTLIHQREALSGYSSYFKYKKGELAVPRSEFSAEFEQCESGIHFFLNLSDALEYNI